MDNFKRSLMSEADIKKKVQAKTDMLVSAIMSRSYNSPYLNKYSNWFIEYCRSYEMRKSGTNAGSGSRVKVEAKK